MTNIVSIHSNEKVYLEVEKQETKKNILYLMMVLIGVQLAQMIDDSTEASVAEIDKLKGFYDQNRKQIEDLLEKLKSTKDEMERLKLDPSTLPKLELLKHGLEKLQNEYQQKIMEGAQIQNKLTELAMIKIAPTQQMVEALENMASRFLDAAIHQIGNQINLR